MRDSPRRILAIDPSLTCTGWAVVAGERLIECGRILLGRGSTARRAHTLYRRLAQICLGFSPPHYVVIEVPSGKVARRMGGIGAGLTTYGMAVGATIVAVCASCKGGAYSVICMDESWTRGIPKFRRQTQIAALYPGYAGGPLDPGGDMSDAIGLALYARDRLKMTNWDPTDMCHPWVTFTPGEQSYGH